VIAAQKEIESLTSQRFSERDSKQADWKSQIQTHSAARLSAPLLDYRRLIFWSRDFKQVEDATDLSRGSSRLLLNAQSHEIAGGHRLAPWRFTFLMSSNKREAPRDKRVASTNFFVLVVSRKREPPRDKPVVSFDF